MFSMLSASEYYTDLQRHIYCYFFPTFLKFTTILTFIVEDENL